MKKLEQYNVEELNPKELENIEGGGFLIFVGLFFGLGLLWSIFD